MALAQPVCPWRIKHHLLLQSLIFFSAVKFLRVLMKSFFFAGCSLPSHCWTTHFNLFNLDSLTAADLSIQAKLAVLQNCLLWLSFVAVHPPTVLPSSLELPHPLPSLGFGLTVVLSNDTVATVATIQSIWSTYVLCFPSWVNRECLLDIFIRHGSAWWELCKAAPACPEIVTLLSKIWSEEKILFKIHKMARDNLTIRYQGRK